jgi:hypothetical protein
MTKSLIAGAVALAVVSSYAVAETTSTTTHSTNTEGSVSSEYSTTRSEQKYDVNGNVIKRTQTYKSKNPLTGTSSSSSSTSVERPDGSKTSVEQQRTTDDSYDGTSTTEHRTTTTVR